MHPTHPSPDDPIYTESIPTAGALYCAGFHPVRVAVLATGVRFEYGPDAKGALQAYLRAKHRIDDLIAAARAEARR
jgi:hypothetical protein